MRNEMPAVTIVVCCLLSVVCCCNKIQMRKQEKKERAITSVFCLYIVFFFYLHLDTFGSGRNSLQHLGKVQDKSGGRPDGGRSSHFLAYYYGLRDSIVRRSDMQKSMSRNQVHSHLKKHSHFF